MSKSPLSGAFSGSSEPAKKKNKKNGAILLISGIALTSSIGGVFATNSIDLGAAVEFGQGTTETISCVEELQTEVTQTYVTQTTFRVSEVVLRGDFDECGAGDVISVSLYGTSGVLADGTAEFDVVASGAAAGEVNAAASQTISFTPANQVDAADVERVVVTTK
jgi:hypothetical protein